MKKYRVTIEIDLDSFHNNETSEREDILKIYDEIDSSLDKIFNNSKYIDIVNFTNFNLKERDW